MASPWLRGVFLGLTVPGLVVMIVMVRQMTPRVKAQPPMEVQKRPAPIARRPFNVSNPYARASVAPKVNRTVMPAWDLREMRTHTNIKRKQVFSDKFLPGTAVVPAGELLDANGLEKLTHNKCLSLIAFFNSEDVEKSRELAAIWNDFRQAEAGKFAFGLCDVRDGDIAGVASEVGLPAIIAYVTKDFKNETVILVKGTGKNSKVKTSLGLSRVVFNVVDNLKLNTKDCVSKSKIPFHDAKLLKSATMPPPTNKSIFRVQTTDKLLQTLSTAPGAPPKPAHIMQSPKLIKDTTP